MEIFSIVACQNNNFLFLWRHYNINKETLSKRTGEEVIVSETCDNDAYTIDVQVLMVLKDYLEREVVPQETAVGESQENLENQGNPGTTTRSKERKEKVETQGLMERKVPMVS